MDPVRPQVADEALLECSVCMDQFETSGPRIPKMLPCQHSFCCECVKNIHDGTRLACPLCRKVCYMLPDDIPNAFILLQLLLEKRKTELKCESYDDHQKPSLETPRPDTQRKTAEQSSRSSRLITLYIALYILTAGLIIFAAVFLFFIFYESFFNFLKVLMKFLLKIANIFGETVIKYIPKVFNFSKIISFRIFDISYHFFLKLYAISPSFFNFYCILFFLMLFWICEPFLPSMVYYALRDIVMVPFLLVLLFWFFAVFWR